MTEGDAGVSTEAPATLVAEPNINIQAAAEPPPAPVSTSTTEVPSAPAAPPTESPTPEAPPSPETPPPQTQTAQQPVPQTTTAVISSYLSAALAKVQFRKRAKLDKILVLAAKKRSIKNDDVEKLLRVSDSTAQRYLNQLVKEGKLRRVGALKQPTYEPV